MTKWYRVTGRFIGVLAIIAASVWAGMIIGMEIQAGRDRQWLEDTAMSWNAAHLDAEGFETALIQLEGSKDQFHQQAARFAREGYRLGRADGMAFSVAGQVESMKSRKK